jgi:hypothetical protein
MVWSSVSVAPSAHEPATICTTYCHPSVLKIATQDVDAPQAHSFMMVNVYLQMNALVHTRRKSMPQEAHAGLDAMTGM